MNSDIDICNMALGHLSVGKEIVSFSERSEEASACNRYYDTARGVILRSFPWPFALDSEHLALLQRFDLSDLADSYGYLFAYQYPPRSLRLVNVYDQYAGLGASTGSRGYGGLIDPERFLTRDYTFPHRVVSGKNGKRIFTNAEDARARFVDREVPAEHFEEDFSLALSFLAAYLIAPRLGRGDKQLRDEMLREYSLAVSNARATGVNEEDPEPLAESDLVRSRY